LAAVQREHAAGGDTQPHAAVAAFHRDVAAAHGQTAVGADARGQILLGLSIGRQAHGAVPDGHALRAEQAVALPGAGGRSGGGQGAAVDDHIPVTEYADGIQRCVSGNVHSGVVHCQVIIGEDAHARTAVGNAVDVHGATAEAHIELGEQTVHPVGGVSAGQVQGTAVEIQVAAGDGGETVYLIFQQNVHAAGTVDGQPA